MVTTALCRAFLALSSVTELFASASSVDCSFAPAEQQLLCMVWAAFVACSASWLHRYCTL